MAAACGALLGVLVCVETQKTNRSIKHFKRAGLSKKHDLEYAQTSLFVFRMAAIVLWFWRLHVLKQWMCLPKPKQLAELIL